MCRFPANRKHSSNSKPILISATSMRHDRCLLTPNLPLCDFNPHTFMRGATASELLGKETIDTFHPTRLRVQARRRPVIRVALTHLFQPTRLVGGATANLHKTSLYFRVCLCGLYILQENLLPFLEKSLSASAFALRFRVRTGTGNDDRLWFARPSGPPPGHSCALRRNARCDWRSGRRGCKSAGCRALRP